MKKILLILCLVLSFSVQAQDKPDVVRVYFSSVCCGIPRSESIVSYLETFEKKHQLTELVTQSGPLGYEGEYALLINATKLTDSQYHELLEGLDATIEQVHQNTPPNGGSVELRFTKDGVHYMR